VALRVGHGFDIHRLAEGPRLVLAGVVVPSQVGCVAHSDGDVVFHALADAVLGACGLGDIGEWFPDTDPAFKGADSALLLAKVLQELSRRGGGLVNVDVSLYLERPRLGELKKRMRERLAEITGLDSTAVGLKARTFESFGAIGEGRAVAATVVVLVETGAA
jgi:2-C-methyl-D-erythritol 2,4-cyclodiphosphate synthase